jgi:hypothetical protein
LLEERFVLDLATVNVRKESPFDVPGAGGRVAYEIELSALLPAMGKHSAIEVRSAFKAIGQAAASDPP